MLVSSGAIALGRKGDETLCRSLAGTMGQKELMKHWQQVFARFGLDAEEVLLTYETGFDPRLFSASKQLVINGNDAIAETNNDFIAAMVATTINADLLVMLSSMNSRFGTGGGETKFQAIAEARVKYGIIVDGGTEHVLAKVMAGEEIGTFVPPLSNLNRVNPITENQIRSER